MTLKGEIDRIATVRFEEKGETRKLARLTLENGKSATVNFGAAASAEKLDINKGDKVRIRGEIEMVGYKKVLTAENVSVEGDSGS